MRISDVITAYILERMDSEDGVAELQRNLLADQLGCVPSQISYVLSSRFTPEQGYVVESRRGGGGYIRIRRVQSVDRRSMLMHVVASLGDTLAPEAAASILQSLLYQGQISQEAAQLCAGAVSDKAFRDIAPQHRDRVRATMLKQLLATLAAQ
jgi:transcriptional regulator CtsR